ncbi:MAG: ATP-dependent DNA helicase [Candidatus Paceibacterota bacterium]
MQGKTNDKKEGNERVFLEAYDRLNTEQKKAVDTIEGPVMVIAGPGTGKTQILTLRIANILRQTDTKPENILALTFTESGVRAMRTRLSGFIGADAYRVPIHTFHSFAGDLIRRYPDSYENIVGGRPATDLEKIMVIEDLLSSGEYKVLRPTGDPTYYVGKILNAITTLKREDISPDKLAEHIAKKNSDLEQIEKYHSKGAHKGKVRGEYLTAEKFLNRNQELLLIYRLYMSELKRLRLYDFEDMILDTIKALKENQEMLYDVQEQYQYILADEHQDVNQSQNHLIELVASYHENPNVFVVGDEKQAIYRFQGASLDNFLYFENIFKGAMTISLTNNYRSDQKILDLAHESIKSDDPLLADLRVPLFANQKLQTTITKQNFSHKAVENDWLVKEVQATHEQGVDWSEIAVIVRSNKEVEELATLFRKYDIPVVPSADRDVLTHPIFINIKELIQLVVDFKNEALLAKLLFAPYWNIPADDLINIFKTRSYKKPLAKLITDEKELKEIGVGEIEMVLKISELVKSIQSLSLTKTPAELLEYLLNESGFLDYVLKADIYDGVRVVRRVYDEVETMYDKKEALDLSSVLKRLELSEKHNVSLSAPAVEVNKEAVQLMTAHKSKGLEFEAVFVPHLNDNVWGASVRSATFDLPIVKHEVDDLKAQAEDDERRLFYVAVTRAKRILSFSYADTNGEGKELVPSRFLLGLEDCEIEDKDMSSFEGDFNPTDSLRTVPNLSLNSGFLALALDKRGWSATSFNNYCKSPWEYIFKNALQIPSIKTPELQFGSAVHLVLEKIVKKMADGIEYSDTEVKTMLDDVLGNLPLSDSEFVTLHERAFLALMSYLPKLKSSLGYRYQTEYAVQAMLETDLKDFPEVMLTGKFDRVDFDEQGRIVKVTDYKTGKPKTKGQIEGTTKDSDGGYKRQLVFYALLLSLQTQSELHSRDMVLSFVEPDSKGNLREESYNISVEEIEELKLSIIEATKNVVNGECMKQVCDDKKCQYCHLVDRFLVG